MIFSGTDVGSVAVVLSRDSGLCDVRHGASVFQARADIGFVSGASTLPSLSARTTHFTRRFTPLTAEAMLKVAAVLLLAALSHTAFAADADNDGVDDAKDLCPGSTRGSREHVDIHGCEHDQVDFDLDGWCNPGMPALSNKNPFTTRHDFCIGVDNCKFVKNAGQEQNYPADNGNDADGSGDACNTGESRRRMSLRCAAVRT